MKAKEENYTVVRHTLNSYGQIMLNLVKKDINEKKKKSNIVIKSDERTH